MFLNLSFTSYSAHFIGALIEHFQISATVGALVSVGILALFDGS